MKTICWFEKGVTKLMVTSGGRLVLESTAMNDGPWGEEGWTQVRPASEEEPYGASRKEMSWGFAAP